jgi:mannitol/fructose-specific phosphotransferase system IIA component (Ntr-type)
MKVDIKQLLTSERVATGIRAENWEAAVRAAGRLLVESGGAEESYIQGMINTTKELGAYIVIAPGLAIPHSRPEDGVIQPCMAVAVLETPVPFGHTENDPVSVLIAFGAVDHSQHIAALQQMAEILSDPDNLAALRTAKTPEKILEIMWSASI